MKQIEIVGIIPARFASSRFPGKPLERILGKTLIQRTWENAKRCELFDEICVATDHEGIFSHVQDFGGIAVMTPENCPNGTDRAAHVIRHKKEYADLKNLQIVVNIQGDEPCVDPETIAGIINVLLDNPDAVMSTAVSPIHNESDALNSAIVKAVITPQGDALYFSRALIPSGKIQKFRSDVTYYRHIGIYAFRKDFLLKYGELPSTPLQLTEDLEHLKVLEHGYKIKVVVVKEAHSGVDHPEDIKKIESILCNLSSSLSQVESALL